MTQKLERDERLSKELRDALAGKRILLFGLEKGSAGNFLQELTEAAEQPGHTFTVLQEAEEITPEDYVILFADETGSPGAALELAASGRPAGALFMSGSCVYGTCFGTRKPREEHELGYACHTAAADRRASGLRIAENLVHRLAVEEGVHIAVARMPEHPDGMRTVEAAMQVLLYGKPGEAYNLPGKCAAQEEHSPLSPIQIVTDTKKVQALIRK